MALQSIWYFTDLPKDVIDIVERDLSEKFDDMMEDSKLMGHTINKEQRNSQNAWIPTSHWVGGFVWHYVQRANRNNFLFDLTNIEGESIQYTRYREGEFYSWHDDVNPSNFYAPIEGKENWASNFVNESVEKVRKLSFVLQLSDPDDYEGGNLQLLDESKVSYIAPRQRGTIILFDSRTSHRVQKVTSGERKSLVGWVVGPRWK